MISNGNSTVHGAGVDEAAGSAERASTDADIYS